MNMIISHVVAVSNNNVILPSNNFIDSSDSGYLSTYGLYKYSISLFFIFLKKQIVHLN